MMDRVLCVDDDSNILAAYQRTLRKQFDIDIAESGDAALAMMAQKSYAVIISDMGMPGMNGIQFLSQAREVAPDTVRMMLTGNADLKTAVEALHRGNIFRYLVKPVPPESLGIALEAGIEQYRLLTAERELLEKTLQGTIRVLMEILATVNPDLFGRAQSVRQNMRLLAQALKISQTWKLELAAMLAQIGLVTIPPIIPRKVQARQPLTDAEAQIYNRMPEISHNLLVNIPRLQPVAEIILYQKKHYNGTGFPDNSVAGTAIPLGARMLLILTDLAEIEAGGLSRPGAFALMQRHEGRYDPKVLEVALNCFAPSRASLVRRSQTSVPVAAKDLQVGQLLAADLETSDGTLLISAGYQITATLLERIRNFTDLAGIKEPIYIEQDEKQMEKKAA